MRVYLLYRLSMVFLKADPAAAGEVGVSGGVAASHLAHFSPASVSPLSVKSSGRPDVTSSRDVRRRSTAPSLQLPVPTSTDASMSAAVVSRSSVCYFTGVRDTGCVPLTGPRAVLYRCRRL